MPVMILEEENVAEVKCVEHVQIMSQLVQQMMKETIMKNVTVTVAEGEEEAVVVAEGEEGDVLLLVLPIKYVMPQIPV
jgi:hypothetical protein